MDIWLFFSIFVDLDFILVDKIMKKGTWPVYSHHDLTLGQ